MGICATRRDDGGIVPSIGGIAPSAATASPMSQNYISQFSQMSPEQLQETVAKVGPTSQIGQIASKILQQKRIMPTQSTQPVSSAVTGSMPSADQTGLPGVPHLADGGPPSAYWMAQMSNSARPSNYGLLNSPSGAAGGRTDTLPHVVAADSYILPADVVSGMGEGDTLSGAKAWDALLHTMPYGIAAPQTKRGSVGIPHPPSLPQQQAKGGKSSGGVPVILANGEIAVSPDDVARFGDGDVKRGLKVLHAFVKHRRARTIKELKALPSPVK